MSVSLTRSGIPRIIPSVLRKHIRDRSERGDYIVKLYLSWFGLSKVIELAPRISKKTFSSITSVPQDYEGYKDKITSFLAEMKDQSEKLWYRYVPAIRTIPLYKGISYYPTWKGTPILDSYLSNYYRVQKMLFSKDKKRKYLGTVTDGDISPELKGKVISSFIPSNIFTNLKHEIAAYAWNVNKIHSFQDGFFSPGILWYPRT